MIQIPGLYYKTLRTRNVRKIDILRNKLVPYIVNHKHTLAWTNTLAYYGIRTLRIRNVFMVQAPVPML